MKTLLAATVVVIVALLVLAVTPFTFAQAGNVCPANPSPPNSADPSVIVEEPDAGDTITSPITISGRARVFEANVRITIFDEAGNELADTFTTAAEAGPALAPYSQAVSFSVSETQRGCIRVFEESARDGSPVNVVQVEVTLAPATTPPTTGTGGLQTDAGGDKHLALYAAGGLAILGAVALALHRRLWT